MTGRMYFLFASTLFIGILCGVYLYVTVYAPSYKSDIDTGENISADKLVVDAMMYGGCAETDSCPSFRLIDGRSYDYLSGIGTEIVKGNLSSSKKEVIEEILTEETLLAASRPIQNDQCESYIDGNDYRYLVSLEGEEYDLDTCTTALAYDADMQEFFLEIWSAMESGEDEGAPVFEGSINDIFWNRFHNPD